MDLQTSETRRSYDKNGFSVSQKEQQAINYLIDQQAEEERKVRWENLLPRILELKQGGRETVRQLTKQVRRGISDSLRSKVWPQLIITPFKSFQECKNKCEIKDICLDLQRTFPTHQQAKILEEKLKIVLNALAYALPQMSYCQGMNFVVWILLLKLSEKQAYDMAYHIFHWERHDELLMNLNLIHQKLFALDKLINKHYPKLFKHLKAFEIQSMLYATSWFITIYCNSLPPVYSFRILQCFVMEGEKVIYRVALQILKMKKHDLKKMHKMQQIVQQLKNFDELLESNIDEFFDSMYKINLSRKEINQSIGLYRQKHRKQTNQ